MANTDPAEWRLYSSDLVTQTDVIPFRSSHIDIVLNEPGSGEVTLPLDTQAGGNVGVGKFAALFYRGAYRAGFFVDNLKYTDISGGEIAERMVSISGRGALALLDQSVIWASDGAAETTRTFTSVTKASILKTLIDEAQARGELATLAYDFTGSVDSASVAWTDSEDYDLPVGTSLLDVARQFARTGGFEYSMTFVAGVFTLSAYSAGIGSNISTTTYFRVGEQCEEVGRDTRGDEIINQYLVKWKKGYVLVNDGTSGKKTGFLSLEQAQSSASATTYASAKLALTKDPKTNKTLRVYDGISPRLFVDYDLGDTISLDRLGTVSTDIIKGIQADFDGTEFTHVTIDFNYILYDDDLRVAGQLDWLTSQWATAHDGDLLEVRQWLNLGLPNGNVNASFIYSGELYVFGNFTQIGNIPATRAAKYNLTTGVWSALSTGISAEVLYATIIGTTIYATTLTTVNKYASGVWSVVGTLTGGQIRAIATDGTNLFVGGSFLAADGLSSDKVAKWTGAAWSNSHAASYDCESLCWFGGLGNTVLYASLFTGVNTTNLQYYSAGAWHTLFTSQAKLCGGVGTDGNWVYWVLDTNHVVRYDGAGLTYDEDLGDLGFTSAGGIISGIVPTPYSAYLTDVYIGRVGTSVQPNGLVRYSGGLFSALGSGAITSGNIRTITVNPNNGDVYIGGSYIGLDSQPINYLNVYVTNFQSLLDHANVDNNNSFDLANTIHNATANAVAATDEFIFYDASTGTISKTTGNTGTGQPVMATSPALVTPTLGVASATSINKVAITAPATSATLTIANGKTLTVSNTIAFQGTDATVFILPGTNDTLAGLATGNVFTANQKIATASNPTLTLDEANSGTSYSYIEDTSATAMSIRKVAASGTALIDIDPQPTDNGASSNAAFRFFRSTTTNAAAQVYIQLFFGDGSGTLGGQISTRSTANTYFAIDHNFGVGLASPAVKFHAQDNTATNNVILEVSRIEAIVNGGSGSAAGFGASQTWYAETATNGTNQALGSITGEWATATNASRKALMKFNVYDTAVREAFRIEASGTVAQISFFGGTTAAKGGTFTQTYSTATLTHSNQTAVDPAAYGAGANGYSTAAMAQAIHAEVIAHKVDIANVKQVVNQIIDILQSFNLVG